MSSRVANIVALLPVLVAGVFAVSPARAQEWKWLDALGSPDAWREVSGGASVGKQSWAAYTTTTIAPFDALARDGFRVRLGSGYGKYSYHTLPPAKDDCRYGFGDGRTRKIDGRVTFTDILAGYQATFGTTTAKVFAGYALDGQDLRPGDICNRAGGHESGFKAALETWTNLTPDIWFAIDASWTQAHETYGVRTRIGYRVMPQISLGIEAAAVGNVAGDETRAGLFVRLDWAGGEIALAGGVGGDGFKIGSAPQDSGWSTLSFTIRY